MQHHSQFQAEHIRQLKLIQSQLNPGPALAKFLFWVIVVLFLVFGAFGWLGMIAQSNHANGLKVGLFSSSCYPAVGEKRDPRCK